MGNNIRIGKDFNVQWAINKVVDGERLPYDLVGKELQLFIVNDNGRKEVAGWKVQGNVIEWTFLGKDQKRIGAYQLVLVENAGKEGMVTVDTCKAFNLVAHSCEEDVDGGSDVVIKTVVLESEVALAPVVKEVGGGASEEDIQEIKNDIADLQQKDVQTDNKLTELSAEIGTKEKALFVNEGLNDLVKEVYTSTEGFDYKAVALVKVRIAYFASSKYYNAIYFHASDNSVILVAQNTYATEAEALAAWNEGIFVSSDGKTYALVSPIVASVVKDFSGETLSHPLTLDFAPSVSASLALNLAKTHDSSLKENEDVLRTCARETMGINLIDKRRVNKGGIVDSYGITANANYYYSHPIYCKPGKYKQTPSNQLSQRPTYATCTSKGEFIKAYTSTNENGYYIYTITEPCYIIVNIGKVADIDAVMFCEYDKFPSEYTPYIASLEYSNIPIENVIGIDALNPLIGKKMLVCGDSIAYGGGRGFGLLIGEKNAMQVTTNAIDGAIITIGGESTKSRIYQQLQKGAEGMDYVIFDGGVNDMLLDNLGEISNSFTAEFDESTFCGSFEKIISTMIAKYPTAKMGYVAVHRIKQWKDDNFTAWQDTGYYSKAIAICRKWGIPVCDLTHEVPSLYEITALKNAYTRNQDGWHPNEEGYRIFYCDKVEAFMRSL